MILQQHGDRAPIHVAERLGVLGLAGGGEGVELWMAIARRMDQLMWPGEVN